MTETVGKKLTFLPNWGNWGEFNHKNRTADNDIRGQHQLHDWNSPFGKTDERKLRTPFTTRTYIDEDRDFIDKNLT